MRVALLAPALALALAATGAAPAQAVPGPPTGAVVSPTILDPRGTRPVEVVKTGRPGQLRVSNPNDTWVTFLWGSFSRAQPDGERRVEAYRTVTVTVDRRRVDWMALLNGAQVISEGTVRGIRR